MTVTVPRIAPIYLQAVRVIVACIFATLTCVPISPAGAAQKRQYSNPMVFSIVRASNPTCEPLCPEWIAAEGEITGQTARAFKSILRRAKGRKLPLLIESTGGEIANAIQVGKLIRKHKMTVEVARTVYVSCKPRDNKCKPELGEHLYIGYASSYPTACISACTHVLAGGVRRILSKNSSVGVHAPVHSDGSPIFTSMAKGISVCLYKKLEECDEPFELGKSGKITSKSIEISNYYQEYTRNQSVEYFNSMGIKEGFFEFTLGTDHRGIDYMSKEELLYYGLVTDYLPDEDLVWLGVCDNPEPPENCVLRKKK